MDFWFILYICLGTKLNKDTALYLLSKDIILLDKKFSSDLEDWDVENKYFIFQFNMERRTYDKYPHINNAVLFLHMNMRYKGPHKDFLLSNRIQEKTFSIANKFKYLSIDESIDILVDNSDLFYNLIEFIPDIFN